ncbi:outer membrane lipoprotein-sorting protein [Verminephrobacter aporrectodeae subsp. tuberculatae]|uniref:outer membrane lipoprotein-sorting protein n=1 Tax=Verminephrobacter aporrectodeae TaxID=1110389 RepID=UPI002238D671|nr:outer membrane lipoprotein-sorting protein [Verminephrobacter aporrectodeae]MCW5256840.1 outer membrane lipoprotein-sorting protein [Verminephrobacter aporrectodeae subsp. tuberculatae]
MKGNLLKHAVFLLVLAWTGLAWSDPDAATADAVMASVRARYKGDTWAMSSSVTLIDKNSSRMQRKVRSISKKVGEDLKSLTVVLEPSRLSGTAFLSYDWSESSREDEAWLYLPDLGKVTRLATGSRADYFLGSDFTYGDLEEIKTDLFDFSFVTSSPAPDGQWLIHAEPRKAIHGKVVDRTGYQRIWYWVDKERRMVVRAKYWLRDPGWVKYYTTSDIQQQAGVWIPREERMVLTQQGVLVHATTLSVEDIQINPRVDDASLSPQALGRSSK